MFKDDEITVYRVGEITRLIKTLLENDLGDVWVEGEVSNVRIPASGHCYFTLKDENAQIAAVMFRGSRTGLRVELRDGVIARVFGNLSVYEKSGQYQIIVRKMEAGGKGALAAAFEALKKKLLAEGLFDPARKKNIPMLPRNIGIVTSPTGAAIRDILNVLFRRFENLSVTLAPVRVQGEGAALEIASAIELFNHIGDFDLLIVGRGGGSIEDLWAFNEEIVARAIAASTIPIISAIGHETDFTIADFVSDLRAPTPSAAAELAVGKKTDFEVILENRARNLRRTLQQHLLNARNRLAAAANSRVFLEPGHLARRAREQISRLQLQLEHKSHDHFREYTQRVDELESRMAESFEEQRRLLSMSAQALETRLTSANPLAILKRGYSITTNIKGEVIKRCDQTVIGEKVITKLRVGEFESEVMKKNDN